MELQQHLSRRWIDCSDCFREKNSEGLPVIIFTILIAVLRIWNTFFKRREAKKGKRTIEEIQPEQSSGITSYREYGIGFYVCG